MSTPRILLTHAKGRFEGLDAALQEAGFLSVHHPLITITPRLDTTTKAAAQALLQRDWLIFTSRSTVEAWQALGLPLRQLKPKLTAVGSKTAAALEASGAEVALIPEAANAEALLALLLRQLPLNATVGMPCGNMALPTLPTGLRGAGYDLAQVVIYDTTPQPMGVKKDDVDAVILCSPSAARALPEAFATHPLATVGPSTQKAVRQRGWRATEAASHEPEALVQAVKHALASAPRQATPKGVTSA